MDRRTHFFFPFLLIGAGVVWLMVTLGYMPSANLWALTHVWPYLLIMAGIGMIVRNYWIGGGAIISALTVLGLVLAVIYAPQLGWDDADFWSISVDYRGGGERGSGHVITETREVPDFSAVTIDYPATVVIRQGSAPSVELSAEDNLMPQLETEVQGGELTIQSGEYRWRQRVNPTETVHIEITVVDLVEISLPSASEVDIEGLQADELSLLLSGAGDIHFRDLEAQSLDVLVSGAGQVRADGQVEMLDVNIDGFGNFHGKDLASQIASVRINGAGQATVRAEEHLTARINGAGSINYYGSPSVNQSMEGVGNISRSGD
jgi:hypothetical protein